MGRRGASKPPFESLIQRGQTKLGSNFDVVHASTTLAHGLAVPGTTRLPSYSTLLR